MTAPSVLDTVAQRSKYFFTVPLPTGNVLIDSLFLALRLIATPEVVEILGEFAEPRRVGDWIDGFAARTHKNRDAVLGAVTQLLAQKLLWNLRRRRRGRADRTVRRRVLRSQSDG